MVEGFGLLGGPGHRSHAQALGAAPERTALANCSQRIASSDLGSRYPGSRQSSSAITVPVTRDIDLVLLGGDFNTFTGDRAGYADRDRLVLEDVGLTPARLYS